MSEPWAPSASPDEIAALMCMSFDPALGVTVSCEVDDDGDLFADLRCERVAGRSRVSWNIIAELEVFMLDFDEAFKAVDFDHDEAPREKAALVVLGCA